MKETCRGTFVCWLVLYHSPPPTRNNKFSRLAFVNISYKCAGLHLSASPIPQTLTSLNSSYKFQPLTLFNFSAVLLAVNCYFNVCASIRPILAFCHLTRRSYRVEQSQHLFQLVRCLIGYFNLYHGWLLSAYSFRNVAINTSISVRNKACKHLPFTLISYTSVKSSTVAKTL